MSDDEIDTSDIPELDEEFFKNATLILPHGRTPMLLAVDDDLAEWFRKQGADYRNIMNGVLREYADARR